MFPSELMTAMIKSSPSVVLPSVSTLHARRRLRQRAKVRDDLLVVGELAIRADVEAEELRRRLDGGGEGGGEEDGDREKRAFHAAGIMADRKGSTI